MRLPNDTERCSIIGRTGSGKTQAGTWQLSLRSYTSMPWIIFNSKGDALLDEIGAQETTIYKPAPVASGLHMVRPMPHEIDAVEQYLWKIWANGNTGVYIDEGYLMGRNNAAFRALLTQGRSKQIPMIILSQRPVYMDRFVWSECEFFQIFHLSNGKDRKTIEDEVLGGRLIPWESVRKYHSLYYEQGEGNLTVLQPVPDRASILKTFRDRIPKEQVQEQQERHIWL